ncbi:MAG: radical SAM protein, partial [Anaerolineae bacterium]
MECPHVPEITAGEFAEALGEHLGPHGRIPLNGTIELTARCNLNCAHCYINLPADDREAQAQELTTQEICSLLDTLADEGTLFLLLTGGEIFVRKDFMEIYIYAKRKGMFINLFTNGTLITERIADYLQDWPPRMVEITLYGATAETYERVTGVPGSYERCMGGIDLLLDRGIPLTLKTMVLTLNRHELEAMKALARDFGVGFRYDAQIWPRLDGRRAPCSLRLSPEEVVR